MIDIATVAIKFEMDGQMLLERLAQVSRTVMEREFGWTVGQ